MDDEEGQALHGTPNESGVAWLLAQHRVHLGLKSVTRSNLFYPETDPEELGLWRPSLLFWTEDVEPPERKEGQSGT